VERTDLQSGVDARQPSYRSGRYAAWRVLVTVSAKPVYRSDPLKEFAISRPGVDREIQEDCEAVRSGIGARLLATSPAARDRGTVKNFNRGHRVAAPALVLCWTIIPHGRSRLPTHRKAPTMVRAALNLVAVPALPESELALSEIQPHDPARTPCSVGLAAFSVIAGWPALPFALT